MLKTCWHGCALKARVFHKAGSGEELRLSTAERQQRRIFEADPPPQPAWNTRFTGRAIDWARPADSRFLVPHDYAADLRHAQR